jgi:multiple sugar transport system substrate-binding protein
VAPEPGAPLRGITWDHPRGRGPLDAIAAAWEADTGVRVAWEARSLLDFGDAPVEELARAYDLLIIDHPHIGTATQAGALVPLDEHLDADFLDDQSANSVGPSHRSYAHEGHHWALAVDAAAQVSAGRPDLLDALGTPWPRTWDDVDALLDVGAAPPVVGLPLAAADAFCCYLSLAANRGTPAAAEPGRLLPTDVGEAVLARLHDLARRVHPSSLDSNPIAMLDRMAAGDEVAYVPLTFGYTNYSRPGVARPVRFGDVPSSGAGPVGAVLGGTGLAVSSSSARAGDAVAFARHVASADVQRGLYVEAGGQPGHRAAWVDEHANGLTGGFFTRTLATMDGCFLRPTGPAWVAFQIEAGYRIHDGLRHGRPPAETQRALERRYAEVGR